MGVTNLHVAKGEKMKDLGKRLKMMSQRVNRDRTDAAKEFLSTLKKQLGERKYRADLQLVTASKSTRGRFSAEIRFNPQLGHPAEKDVITLVAQSYPSHDIDWEVLEVDTANGIVSLMLEPSVEVMPVESVKSIPAEFVSIGTGLYKRARDASGKVNEIWTLKKGEGGLALYRNPNDLEVTAEDESGFRAGDVVNTPYGVGRIQRFDDLGNAFVQVGTKQRLVGAVDLQKYDIDKERSKLKDYYAEAYGDPSFADALVKKMEKKD